MRKTAPVLAIVCLALASCAPPRPRPPLWDTDRYSKVLILPARMAVSTGLPPFTTPDTELSERQGALMQGALALVFVQKGYDVLSPPDTNEKLGKDRALLKAFQELAARRGIIGPAGEDFGTGFIPGAGIPGPSPSSTPSYPARVDSPGKGPAAVLSKAFGADLIVMASGRGESHGFGENLLQALISKGQGNAPPSFLNLVMVAVDGTTGADIARLGAQMGYTENPDTLTRWLASEYRLIPRHAETAPPAPPPPR